MNEFILIRPDMKYADQIAEYRSEFIASGDSMDGTGMLRQTDDASEYIKLCRDYELPEKTPSHLVPATQFLLICKSNDRVLGMLQVRHCLNDYLEKFGENMYRPVEGITEKEGDFTINQGYLEMSNVNVISEMVEMIAITRNYETNQKFIQSTDSSLEQTVTLGTLR